MHSENNGKTIQSHDNQQDPSSGGDCIFACAAHDPEYLIEQLRTFRWCDAEIRGSWEVEAMYRFLGLK
jgi:hypothetical protein